MSSTSTQIGDSAPFVLGWGEWVALPDLGLPAIKAKVDTGARTSALHAFLIEPFGTSEAPMVRFGIHPVPGRHDIEIYCSAPVVDRREVTSSNGERETRYVIESRIAIGAKTWKVEITLTNREQMAYRMLIGRQAIRGDIVVDPSAAFHQPKLSYKLYRHLPRHDPVRRPLRLAVLTADPEKPFNRRLAEAAAARGHALEIIATRALRLSGDPASEGLVVTTGGPLAHYDAVVPRIGARASPLAIAGLRQLEHLGAVSLNPADALARLASPLATAQRLLQLGLPVAALEVDRSSPNGRWPGTADAIFTRVVLVGGRPVATLHGRRRLRDAGRRFTAERRLAVAATRALGLGLAAVDICGTGKDARIVDVSATLSFATAERLTGARLAEAICLDIEGRIRSWVRREPLALEAPAPGDDQP